MKDTNAIKTLKKLMQTSYVSRNRRILRRCSMAKLFFAKAIRFGDVYDEITLNGTFIRAVDELIRHSLREYRTTHKQKDLTDLALQAQFLLDFQGGSTKQTKTQKNCNMSEYRRWRNTNVTVIDSSSLPAGSRSRLHCTCSQSPSVMTISKKPVLSGTATQNPDSSFTLRIFTTPCCDIYQSPGHDICSRPLIPAPTSASFATNGAHDSASQSSGHPKYTILFRPTDRASRGRQLHGGRKNSSSTERKAKGSHTTTRPFHPQKN